METIVAVARINRALHSKIPLAIKYLMLPGDLVRVFRERSGRWEEPFTVTRVSKKIISVTDGINVEPFNTSAVILIAPKSNDRDLQSDMEIMRAFVIRNYQIQDPVEILNPSDLRTISQNLDAIKSEISGLLAREAF